MRFDDHEAPDRADIEKNKSVEPEGERIRLELIEFLERNRIVSIRLDTDKHCIDIQSARLPPETRPALTLWGSIYVRVDGLGHGPAE
jgi:hypothetical protein